MSDEKVILTIDDVAQMLGISTRHVRRLYYAGELPKPMRLGRCLRWHKPTLDEFLCALGQKAAESTTGRGRAKR